MMGSLTSMFGSMFGEQSKAYKIMFAADKAYAIAAAGIAIQQNIAAASKAGFPLNIPLIAGAVAQGAALLQTSGQLRIKALLMVVTLVEVGNMKLLELCTKARLYGPKKTLNVGVVLV